MIFLMFICRFEGWGWGGAAAWGWGGVPGGCALRAIGWVLVPIGVQQSF